MDTDLVRRNFLKSGALESLLQAEKRTWRKGKELYSRLWGRG